MRLLGKFAAVALAGIGWDSDAERANRSTRISRRRSSDDRHRCVHVIHFKSRRDSVSELAALKQFNDSPEYREAAQTRQKKSQSRFFAVEGVSR